jgi:hypothetical protein
VSRNLRAEALAALDFAVNPGYDLERISIAFESPTSVVAGLVPATPNVKAPSENNRDGRDKPGHDAEERPSAST